MISPRRPSGCWRGDPTRWVSRIPVSYINGLVALVMFFASQLLICALHRVGALLNGFPASILAMLLVALVMLGMSWKIGKGVDGFYERRLRGPTDLLNRHMSIGFTVPFMMIIKSPAVSGRDIGLIVGCFILTGVLNSGLVYILAHCLQRLARGMMGAPPKQALTPVAAVRGQNVPPIVVEPPSSPAPRRSVTADERFSKCLSDASTLTNTPAGPSPEIRPPQPERRDTTPSLTPPLPEPSATTSATRSRALDILMSNPILFLSLLAIPTIGLPIALTTGNTAPLDTTLLFLLWTASLATQRAARSAPALSAHPRWRTFLSAALNAVLWTALGMIAYCCIKTALTHHPSTTSLEATLSSLSTGTTLSDLIIGSDSSSSSSSSSQSSMGAGDIAVLILNAGIVSWGLKLFECRAQLASPSGFATVLTASAAALLNVVCGPLLARALGLRLPGWCLAFAARSVTLALAGPAMGSLGGDVGVNAAMVVFSGIVFQVGLGLGAGSWLRGVSATARATAGGDAALDRDVEKGGAVRPPPPAGGDGGSGNSARDGEHKDEEESDADSPLTVATGVMVGVNGAAMGTAHLYEAGSRAAPYAALSMTVFGVMTVVMTLFDRLVHWLVAQVAS